MSIATATQLQYEQLRDAASVVDTLSQELSQGTRRHADSWFEGVDLALAELDTVLGAIYDLPVGGDGTILEATSLQLEALRDTSRRVALGVQGFAQGDRRRFVLEYLSAVDSICLECYQAVRDIRGEPPVVVVAIHMDPDVLALEIGDTQQLSLTAEYSDGTTADIPAAEVVWTSDAPEVVTVSDTGLVTAVAAGSAYVTGVYADLSANALNVVTDPLEDAFIDMNFLTQEYKLDGVAVGFSDLLNWSSPGNHWYWDESGNYVSVPEGVPAFTHSVTGTPRGLLVRPAMRNETTSPAAMVGTGDATLVDPHPKISAAFTQAVELSSSADSAADAGDAGNPPNGVWSCSVFTWCADGSEPDWSALAFARGTDSTELLHWDDPSITREMVGGGLWIVQGLYNKGAVSAENPRLAQVQNVPGVYPQVPVRVAGLNRHNSYPADAVQARYMQPIPESRSDSGGPTQGILQDPTWFNGIEGTVVVEIQDRRDNWNLAYGQAVYVGDGAEHSFGLIGSEGDATLGVNTLHCALQYRDGEAVNQYLGDTDAVILHAAHAVTYDAAGYQSCVNGGDVLAAATDHGVPPMAHIRLGGGTQIVTGNYVRFRYYPRKLTEAELKRVTNRPNTLPAGG